MPDTSGKGYIVIPFGESPIISQLPVPDQNGDISVLFMIVQMPTHDQDAYATLQALGPTGEVIYSDTQVIYSEENHTSAGLVYFELIPSEGAANLQLCYGPTCGGVGPGGVGVPPVPPFCDVLDVVPGTCGQPLPELPDPCARHGQVPNPCACDPSAGDGCTIDVCARAPTAPVLCQPGPDVSTDPCDYDGSAPVVCDNPCAKPPLQGHPPCVPIEIEIDVCESLPIVCNSPIGCDSIMKSVPGECDNPPVCDLQSPDSAFILPKCPPDVCGGPDDPCISCDANICNPCPDGGFSCLVNPTTECEAPTCYNMAMPLALTPKESSNSDCGTVIKIDGRWNAPTLYGAQYNSNGTISDGHMAYVNVDWATNVGYSNPCSGYGGKSLYTMGAQWSGPKRPQVGSDYPIYAGFVFHGATIQCADHDDHNLYADCAPNAESALWVRPDTRSFVPPGTANFTFLDVANVWFNGNDREFKDARYCDPYAAQAVVAFDGMNALMGLASEGVSALALGAFQSVLSNWFHKEACDFHGIKEMPTTMADGHRIGNGVYVAPKYNSGISFDKQKEALSRVMVIAGKCAPKEEGYQFATVSRAEWAVTAHTLFSTEQWPPQWDGVATQQQLQIPCRDTP